MSDFQAAANQNIMRSESQPKIVNIVANSNQVSVSIQLANVQTHYQKRAHQLTAQFLRDLADLVELEADGGNKSLLSQQQATDNKTPIGAKHKQKELAKIEGKQDRLSQVSEIHAVKKGKGKEEKKKAAPKADRIKKPLSAFMLYCNARRPFVKNERPDLVMVEISKLVADEWNQLTKEAKQQWFEKAAQLKLDYQIKSYNIGSTNQNHFQKAQSNMTLNNDDDDSHLMYTPNKKQSFNAQALNPETQRPHIQQTQEDDVESDEE